NIGCVSFHEIAIDCNSRRGLGGLVVVSFGTTAWTIANTAGELSKKLYELGTFIQDREVKQQMDEILDRVLEQSASELEDENRELRENLRIKGDVNMSSALRFGTTRQSPNNPLSKVLRKQNCCAEERRYCAA